MITIILLGFIFVAILNLASDLKHYRQETNELLNNILTTLDEINFNVRGDI